MMIKRYSEVSELDTFLERYKYLALGGSVGRSTFGFDRHINQKFYKSREWRDLRHFVIVRDEACDLGVRGHDIFGRVLIHHMNPLSVDDIVHGDEDLLNPEFLICVTHDTHNAIHYGDEGLLPRPFVPRRPGDTKLW
jgi:hypothetical protein